MQSYIIQPRRVNDLHHIERWRSSLFNGKLVEILVHVIFNSGSFYIDLTPNDVRYLNYRENINIWDFKPKIRDLGKINYYKVQILNDHTYDTHEMIEINKMIYGKHDNCNSPVRSDVIDRENMYNNFWVLDIETYELCQGCCLIKN